MLSPAEIAESLAQDRSKANVNRLVSRMAQEGVHIQSFIQSLVEFKPNKRWIMLWTLGHYIEQNRHLKEIEVLAIWNGLESTSHPSMLRDYWRMLSFLEIPEEISGHAYQKALETVKSERFPIAVRAHAMLVGYNIAKPYPELLTEYALVLETLQAESESAGLRSRSKNLLKKINKSVKALR